MKMVYATEGAVDLISIYIVSKAEALELCEIIREDAIL
jgi:hypothetical protein